MMSEQQASKELMARGWRFDYFEELGKTDAALKEVGMLPGEVLQLIKTATELKDPDFRAAAFSLMELKKETGKSYKEAETYIQGIEGRITSKGKQYSDWTGKVEKVKAEQTKNKRLLKEDTEKLNQELSKNAEVRANIEETVKLKADLKKISLDLPTFTSIVRETVLKGGITPHIAKKIKEAIKTFGSLEREEETRKKAILNLSREEKGKREAFSREEEVKKKAILNLSREEREKKELLRVLDKSIALKHEKSTQLSKLLDYSTKLLLDSDEQIERNKWQWEFFQLFISMLLASPSAPDSLVALGLKIQELHEKGWTHSGEVTVPEQRRALFISLVMGGYLHSVHCNSCGASFIVNMAYTANNQFKSHYNCPVCPNSWDVKPDDTFLELMVSPERAEKLQSAKNSLAQLEKMKTMDIEALGEKLKVLDNIPPEVYKFLQEGGKLQFKA